MPLRILTRKLLLYNIQNNFEGSNAGPSNIYAGIQNYECTFNPLEKLMEALEENKRLYEARLKDKEEMIASLQQLLNKVS